MYCMFGFTPLIVEDPLVTILTERLILSDRFHMRETGSLDLNRRQEEFFGVEACHKIFRQEIDRFLLT